MYKLKQGNCLEVMQEIPAGSVDMILCDLPYGTTACKWDTVIPFEPLWSEYKRVIKKNGAIVLFGSEPFSSHLRLSAFDMFAYDWYWVKNRPSGALHAKRQPMRAVETISTFYTTPPNYNPQMVARTDKELSRLSKESVFTVSTELDNRGFAKSGNRTDNALKYPNNVLNIPTVANRDSQKVAHPTQKPVALCEYLIKTYTNEGEWVLDNTMGSGTTGVACVNTNRNFIGIEQDEKYFSIAKQRIEKSQIDKTATLA